MQKTRVVLFIISVLLMCPMPKAHSEEVNARCAPCAACFSINSPDQDLITNHTFTTNPSVELRSACSTTDDLAWDFGDDQSLVRSHPSATAAIRHTYEFPGTYTVTLTGCGGCPEPCQRTITIFEEGALSCPSKSTVHEISLKPFKTDAITYWVKKLRSSLDRMTSIPSECSDNLATLEFVLRKRGNYLLNKLNDDTNLMQTEGLSSEELNKLKQRADVLQARVKKIRLVTPLSYDKLFQTFDDYEKLFFKFSAGYEFTTVNKLFQKGNPLFGFIVHSRWGEGYTADSDHGPGVPVWGRYGWHSKFTALVRGSGEQETVISGETSTSGQPAPKNTGDDKALGFEEELFIPVFRSARIINRELWAYVGPVGIAGAQIVEKNSTGSTVTDMDTRLYAGIKIAFNPELYTDILYGKTSSLHSERLELRSQMPIYKINNSAKLFLGGIANIGVKNKMADETDNYRIYITWNVNFNTVYEYFSGRKLDKSIENP